MRIFGGRVVFDGVRTYAHNINIRNNKVWPHGLSCLPEHLGDCRMTLMSSN